MFPVDPDVVETHWRHPAGNRYGCETGIVADHRRDPLLMRVSDGLASPVRLEQ